MHFSSPEVGFARAVGSADMLEEIITTLCSKLTCLLPKVGNATNVGEKGSQEVKKWKIYNTLAFRAVQMIQRMAGSSNVSFYFIVL